MERKVIDSFSGEYRFLSNFYPCNIEFEGEIYPSTEHAYQAAKTLDHGIREQIRDCGNAGKAKQLGRKLTIREDWEEIKIRVMGHLCWQKFNQEPFRTQLIATRDAELIEGNHWNDTFWGVCRGVGENNLGKILMKCRMHLDVI